MDKPIILVGGGTGVGTSSIAFELSKHLGIPSVTSTDAIREVIRSTINPALNPALMCSTYLAGQTENYAGKDEAVQHAEILRGYKNQCSAVWVGIEGVLARAATENIPVIIEGVHIRSGQIQRTDIHPRIRDRLIEYLVFVGDAEVHKGRFTRRGMEAPARPMKKYLGNFREIRWIRDYLLSQAKEMGNIILVDNSGTLEDGTLRVVDTYNSRFSHR